MRCCSGAVARPAGDRARGAGGCRRRTAARVSTSPRCLGGSEAPWDVHILKTPLVGLEAVGAVLGDLYPGLVEHAVVLLASRDRKVVQAFDFLPARPMHPLTPLQLLTPGGTPGVLRRRAVGGLPRSTRVWRVGTPAAVPPGDASDDAVLASMLAEVDAFHRGTTAWTSVKVGTMDCNAYARHLARYLVPCVPDALALDPRRGGKRATG